MTFSEQVFTDQLTNQERQTALTFVEKIRQNFDGQLISAILFGSRARGEATADSDMDILVIMFTANPETREAIHHLAVEVWLEYGIYLCPLVRSEAHWRKLAELQTQLHKNICRDGIDLLELAAKGEQNSGH